LLSRLPGDDMADAADKSDKSDDEAPAKAGGSKLIPILLVVNLLLVAAVLAVFLLKGGGGSAKPASHGAEGGGEAKAEAKSEGAGEAGARGEGGEGKGPLPGPTQKMADFVVHLRDPEADRYARVSFEVEVATEEEKNKLTGYMPRIRDSFIAYLSDRTLEELRGSESIARTKAALTERMAQLSPGVKIRGLYVTDLVIQ
jgi:flagellar protein FliL